MRLTFSPRFEKRIRAATAGQADAVQKALQLFVTNSRHPSLNFEKVKSTDYCTIRADRGDRIALRRTGSEQYDVVDFGTHDYVYRRYG